MNIIFFLKRSLACVLLVSAGFTTLSTHAVEGTNTRFISGLITTQPRTATPVDIVTKVTGKLIGKMPEDASKLVGAHFTVNFTAVKLDNGLFLAQVNQTIMLPPPEDLFDSPPPPVWQQGWSRSVAVKRKTGVFFKINTAGQIQTIKAVQTLCHPCTNIMALSDDSVALMTSEGANGYGISDITISSYPAKTTEYFISGFITTQPQSALMEMGDVIITVKGTLGGSAFNPPVDFTALQLSNTLFLAQAVTATEKRGVFFEIEGGLIKVTQVRYCALTDCQHRNVALTDSKGGVANRQESGGYGISDVTLLVRPAFVVADSFAKVVLFPDFVTTQPAAFLLPNENVLSITGQFAGSWVDTPVDFTATRRAYEDFISRVTADGVTHFLAQIVTDVYKKGVFFEIGKDGTIKATQARFCRLTDCQNRNVQLSDTSVDIATSKTALAYGIFDLKATLVNPKSRKNLALNKRATQSSQHAAASKAVDGKTDGVYSNGSVTHTKAEQHSWWRVDLGDVKLIQQINIYNRTDCCKERLSDYQVSISNTVDFSTIAYQKIFHGYPDPKKIIDLDIQGVLGRYVRIQLLSGAPLSLAEVQVLGFDTLRILHMIDSDKNEE